jgi:hypothetical protein
MMVQAMHHRNRQSALPRNRAQRKLIRSLANASHNQDHHEYI